MESLRDLIESVLTGDSFVLLETSMPVGNDIDIWKGVVGKNGFPEPKKFFAIWLLP